jgi:hypothetical protein
MVSAMLRLMAVQVDVVEYSANSITRLDGLVSLFTSTVAHTTFDSFLCGT